MEREYLLGHVRPEEPQPFIDLLDLTLKLQLYKHPRKDFSLRAGIGIWVSDDINACWSGKARTAAQRSKENVCSLEMMWNVGEW